MIVVDVSWGDCVDNGSMSSVSMTPRGVPLTGTHAGVLSGMENKYYITKCVLMSVKMQLYVYDKLKTYAMITMLVFQLSMKT